MTLTKLGKRLDTLAAEAPFFVAAWSDMMERYRDSLSAARSAMEPGATRRHALFSLQRASDHLFIHESEHASRLVAAGDVESGAHRLLNACTAAQVRDAIAATMKRDYAIPMLLTLPMCALYHRILAKCICHEPLRSSADRLHEELEQSGYVHPPSNPHATPFIDRLRACAEGVIGWRTTGEFLALYTKQIFGREITGVIRAEHNSYAMIPAELVFASVVRGAGSAPDLAHDERARLPDGIARWVSALTHVAAHASTASLSAEAIELVEVSRRLVPHSPVWSRADAGSQ